MIYITGDTHIDIDIRKLSSKNFKDAKNMTKKDYVIIMGDFGLLWKNEKDAFEEYWTKWLDNKNFTTLFIEGNHDHNVRLSNLEQVNMFGSVVGKVSDSIYHLKRGYIYEIEGSSFFCFGGATSHDKEHRTEFIDWWREEVCSYAECELAIDNLLKYNNKVDYILTHTMPESMGLKSNYECPTARFLQYVLENVKYKSWYCGHFHEDKKVDNNINIVYNNIIKL